MAGLRKPGDSGRPSPTPRAAEESEPQESAASTDSDESTESTGTAEATGSAGQAAGAGPGETEGSPDTARASAGSSAEHPGDDVEGETDAEAASEGAGEPAKPTPRAKRRNVGADKPEDTSEVAEPAAPGTPPRRLSAARGTGRSKRGLSRRGSYVLATVLVVVAAVFTTGAVLAKQQYSEASDATDNAALVDVAKTEQAKKAMKQAAERLFSYDYRDIGKTEKAADELLVSKEVQHTYTTLMGEVKRLAPKQQIVVTVKASEAAVVELHDDQAKVMVYADQTATRTKSGKSSGGGAALWFKTELRDGKWKVTGLDTYSSGAPIKAGNKQGGKSGAPKPPEQGKPGKPPQGN